MNGELRPLVAGRETARLAPDALPAMGEERKFGGGNGDGFERG